MKNRKGFTIVELVIVIAVIAILAAVLIPTFSGVIQKANASSAQQEAASAMKIALSMSSDATLPAQTAFVSYDKSNNITYCYEYVNNKLAETDAKGAKDMTVEGYSFVIDSVIVSVDYFLADGSETLTPVSGWAEMGSKQKELCAKLYNFDTTKYAALNLGEGKVWYKFTKEGTGYKFSIKKAESAPAESAEADAVVTVYTSVDLKKDIIVFVPKHTKSASSNTTSQ